MGRIIIIETSDKEFSKEKETQWIDFFKQEFPEGDELQVYSNNLPTGFINLPLYTYPHFISCSS
jgi:hypothetical protein